MSITVLTRQVYGSKFLEIAVKNTIVVHPYTPVITIMHYTSLFSTLFLLGCESEIKTPTVETNEDIVVSSDADGDGYVGDDDCDDSDPNIHPGVEEICDGLDNNCDGEIDEGVAITFYLDADEDGFGDPNISEERCEQGVDSVPNNNDCDDSDPNIHPGVEEVCNGLDDDCDDLVDDGIGDAYFLDADGDGFGDPDREILSCNGDSNIGQLVENADDCNDQNQMVHPDAVEYCDQVDNDCNGSIDEVGTNTYYQDADGDGFGDDSNTVVACTLPENHAAVGGDCNDNNPSVHPNGTETCDAVDNDCNGWTDDADPGLQGGTTYYFDADGDGFGSNAIQQTACSQPANHVSNADDCNDLSATSNPNATEVCDGIDNDCDGLTDDADSSIDVSTQQTAYLDGDGDGFGGTATTTACALPSNATTDNSDCDDTDASVSPNSMWYFDGDGDGFGGASFVLSCVQPTGYVSQSSDCNDSNADIHPNTEWYFDGDGDGYGAGAALIQCTEPSNYVRNNDDCNNIQPLAWSGAEEVCDSIDNDCDGEIDEDVTPAWYFDGDGDGYGEDSAVIYACTPPSNVYVENGGDCDNTSADYSPGNAPGCDGRDLNCDGQIDNDSDGDGFSDFSCGGTDCDDSDVNFTPEIGGGCPMGRNCNDILSDGNNSSDVYLIDPDGVNYGKPPFEAYCDMGTDGGGWTQISYVFRGDYESYNTDYASVFSDTARGMLGAGSYKVDASDLILDAVEFRYSEPYDYTNLDDSTQNVWYADVGCEINADVLDNILNPGIADQPGADIACTNLNTGTPSTTAVKMNYQGWTGSWYPTRLWVGLVDDTSGDGNYHGDYTTNGVATWSNVSGTLGIYYGPAGRNYTSVAFWVR